MSLEQALAANTAALVALTNAMGAAPAKPAAAAAAAAETVVTRGPGRPPKAAAAAVTVSTPKVNEYVGKYSKADAHAAANEVKEIKGVAAAKAIISELGYDKMSNITDPKDVDALYEKSMAALGESEGAVEDDGGI